MVYFGKMEGALQYLLERVSDYRALTTRTHPEESEKYFGCLERTINAFEERTDFEEEYLGFKHHFDKARLEKTKQFRTSGNALGQLAIWSVVGSYITSSLAGDEDPFIAYIPSVLFVASFVLMGSAILCAATSVVDSVASTRIKVATDISWQYALRKSKDALRPKIALYKRLKRK